MEATRNGDPAVIERYIVKRRKDSFKSFYRGDKGATQYCNWDVPHIAGRYHKLWKGLKLNYIGESKRFVRRHFNPEDLSMIEADLRMILACSNFYGRLAAVPGSPGSIVAKQYVSLSPI